MTDHERRVQRTRVLIRWLSGVVTAVVVSWLLTSYLLNDALVTGCTRTSRFKALAAKGWSDASQTRRRQGDFAAANRYAEISYKMLKTIPYPKDGTYPVDEADLKKGCEDAYPPPIPFIK